MSNFNHIQPISFRKIHHLSLNITFTDNYPYCPPKINLITKIYHPNIKDEEICSEIIKEHRWSPSLTL